MIKLYQFAVSHYCEKVRWALKYKRLPHENISVLPGLHARKMKKLVGTSSVPVIKDDNHCVGGSADIISYLDDQYPRFSLTPEDESDKKLSLEVEQWADKEIGPHVRVLAYAVLTKYPDVLVNVMGQGGPWYKSFYLKKAMPKIIDALRSGYGIDEKNTQLARENLHKSIEKIEEKLIGGKLLVGDTFSRADLAVAALWAPIFQIGKYGLEWPDDIPEEYAQLANEFAMVRPWVERMYASHK